MRLKLAFATVSAMALLSGAALAGDDNQTNLYQEGDYNSATINQSGNENNAGDGTHKIIQMRTADVNAVPTRNNVLTIVQSGNSNDVGLGTNANSFGYGSGVYQRESYAGSTSYKVHQNIISINQSSSDNEVGAVSQESATHSGVNGLYITQRGDGGNRVGSVSQFRTQSTQNVTTIDQAGSNNNIGHIEQYVREIGNDNFNVIAVTMSGKGNGHGGLTGAAQLSGASSSTIIQGRASNAAKEDRVSLNISGDENQFGVTQYGNFNSSSGNISGNYNQFGTYQIGIGNTASLVMSGDYNNVGVSQSGDGNIAGTVVGGSNNQLNIQQSDNDNSVSARIDGDHNGGGLFTDDAAKAFASSFDLTSGDLVQETGKQSLSLNITAGSNNNQFAFLQTGGLNNGITATISGTGDNQAVGVQEGDSNTATLAQGGNSNVAIFHQIGSSNVATFSQ